jgi:hypothetical protein
MLGCGPFSENGSANLMGQVHEGGGGVRQLCSVPTSSVYITSPYIRAVLYESTTHGLACWAGPGFFFVVFVFFFFHFCFYFILFFELYFFKI